VGRKKIKEKKEGGKKGERLMLYRRERLLSGAKEGRVMAPRS